MPCVNSFMSLSAVEEVELEKVHNKHLMKVFIYYCSNVVQMCMYILYM